MFDCVDVSNRRPETFTFPGAFLLFGQSTEIHLMESPVIDQTERGGIDRHIALTVGNIGKDMSFLYHFQSLNHIKRSLFLLSISLLTSTNAILYNRFNSIKMYRKKHSIFHVWSEDTLYAWPWWESLRVYRRSFDHDIRIIY